MHQEAVSDNKDDTIDESTGLAAIEAALASVYGEGDSQLLVNEKSATPFEAVRMMRRQSPAPHWHYVSHGFTELYDKQLDDPNVSGFGFELSFRLLDDSPEDEPPLWPAHLMHKLAEFVFANGGFTEGQYLKLDSVIDAKGTRLPGVVFREDPALGTIDTPNGKVQFLEMVHLHHDEMQAARGWNVAGMLELVSRKAPDCMCDPDRRSLMEDPGDRAIVRAKAEAEGSETEHLPLEHMRLLKKKRLFRGTQYTFEFSRGEAGLVSAVLRGRLLFGRSCIIGDHDSLLWLDVGDEGTQEFMMRTDRHQFEETTALRLQRDVAEELCQVLETQRAGPLKTWPRLTVQWKEP